MEGPDPSASSITTSRPPWLRIRAQWLVSMPWVVSRTRPLGVFCVIRSLTHNAGRRRFDVKGGRDQSAGIIGFRCSEDLLGSSHLDHLAVAHNDDLICERAHNLQIVAD